jgi:uncharacterized coiled-coil DUF342 family protein
VSARHPVSSAQPTLKDWLLLSAGAFGIGLVCTLPIQRNFLRSAQLGLLTIPPVLLSVLLLSRQRHQVIAQQTAVARQKLQRLRGQTQAFRQALTQQDQTTWGLQQQAHHLQNHLQQWQQAIATHQQQCQAYEQYAAELEQKCRHYRAASQELGQLVSQRRQQVKSLEIDLDHRQGQAQVLNTRLIQLQQQQAMTQKAWQTAKTELSKVQAEMQTQLGQHLATQAKLEQHIPELERRWDTLKIEAVSTEVVVRQLQQQVSELEEQHEFLGNQVTELNELIAQKQTLFEQVDRTLVEHQQACQARSLELKQLESKLVRLQQKPSQATVAPTPPPTQSIPAVSAPALAVPALPRPALPPANSRPVAFLESRPWQELLVDTPHLEILRHIEAHGVITEAEAGKLLGNPRLARQFANKLREYAAVLPFAIRVEASATGNRYLKEPLNR